MKRQALLMLASGVLLWCLVAQANHLLAPWHVTLFPAVLFFLFAALRLPHRVAWLTALALGAWHDAATPAPAGTHLLLFAVACAVVLQVRGRLARAHHAPALVVGLLVNLGLFLALSVVIVGHAPEPGAAWLRLLADLFWSQLALALVLPWWFALQSAALQGVGAAEPQKAESSA